MAVQDYPITELYGCQPGYPLNQNLCPSGQGFHNGIDYGCPTGTPVVVNGVTIGLSGATGYVTGPHLHVGRWVNGSATNPGSGGFQFDNATVTEINQDATNGKYVRVQADGASWVYLHLSDNNKVSVGQALQGGDMPASQEQVDKTTVQLEYNNGLLRDATQNEINDWVNNPRTVESLQRTIQSSGEHNQVIADQQLGVKARTEHWQQQIADLKKQLAAEATPLKPGKYSVN